MRRQSKSINTVMKYAPIIALILGSVIGSIMSISRVSDLGVYIDSYILSLNANADKSIGVIEAFIKYGKVSLCIWLLGLIPIGIYIIPLVLFIKGFSYGFTTMVVLKALGLNEGFSIMLLYLPQSFLLIPLYIIGAYISISYIKRGSDIRLYTVYLIPMLVVVMLTSLLEVFALPVLL